MDINICYHYNINIWKDCNWTSKKSGHNWLCMEDWVVSPAGNYYGYSINKDNGVRYINRFDIISYIKYLPEFPIKLCKENARTRITSLYHPISLCKSIVIINLQLPVNVHFMPKSVSKEVWANCSIPLQGGTDSPILLYSL